MVTITDPNGNAITWSSGGTAGFTGSRKSTLIKVIHADKDLSEGLG